MRVLIVIFSLLLSCKTNKISRENVESSTQIVKIQESMLNENITDYFIIEHIQYGMIRIAKKKYSKAEVCLPNGTYYSLYAFWNKNELNYIQKFDNCGEFQPIIIKNSSPYEYYQNNSREIIKSEVKQYKTDNESYMTLTHQPLRYFWFVKQNEIFTSNFDKFDLTTTEDEPNLNHESNNEQPIVKLNEKSEKLIILLNEQNKFKR
ncbi:hypothetical protein [Aquimarina sp. AU119]|uniref:hypothetical protein n=1 Tax=Aquimarina sp. AU119 TaxID=2108528 RepID=UPI000D68DD46|nr:hypothetical protein [Aquimarina sp. AU119]